MLVTIEDLAKSYVKVLAVVNLSYVKEGSLIGSVCPNGFRKITTIKVIFGRLRSDRGKVEFEI